MKVLGAFGSKTKNSQLSSYLLDENTVIDAGNLIQSLGNGFLDLENVILTHAHFDHIADLPIAIDTYYTKIKQPIKVHGTKEVLEILQTNIFNNKVWPDFSKIPLLNGTGTTIEFHLLEYHKESMVGNFILYPYDNHHTFGSTGFIINNRMLFTSDTFICHTTWELLNKNKNIKQLVIEVSFPSSMKRLAVLSKHLTPVLLQNELKSLQREDVKIYINHLKYEYYDIIIEELKMIGLYDKIIVLEDNSEITIG